MSKCLQVSAFGSYRVGKSQLRSGIEKKMYIVRFLDRVRLFIFLRQAICRYSVRECNILAKHARK